MRYFITLFFSLIALFFIACDGQSTASTKSFKLLIPLYAYPTSNDSWSELVTLKQNHSLVEIVAIVNQSNGTFDTNSSSFYDGIKTLSNAKITPVGYVNTKSATRTLQEVQTDVDNWALYYKEVGLKGIFFDVTSSHTDKVSYYKTLSEYAKSKDLNIIILNPGTTVDEEFFQEEVASIIVTKEEYYENGINHTNFNTPTDTTNLAILLHHAPQTISLEAFCEL